MNQRSDFINQPRLSIVVATLNNAGTLERCLDSVVEQTYKHWQLIVADGLSTDGTVTILEQYSNSIDVWFSRKDKSVYHAWNSALNHVDGDWVLFLGADDFLWSASTLHLAADQLMALSDSTRIAYGKVASRRESSETYEERGVPWEKTAPKFFTSGNNIPHQAVFHRADLFSDLGNFDESFYILGDYEMLLRELKAKEPHHFDLVIAAWTDGGLSTRPSNDLIRKREIFRALAKQGFKQPRIRVITSLAIGFIKVALHAVLPKKAYDSIVHAARVSKRSVKR